MFYTVVSNIGDTEMKYLTYKTGTKFISFDEDGNLVLTKEPTMLWPIDMKDAIDEAMAKLQDQGMNVRAAIVEQIPHNEVN